MSKLSQQQRDFLKLILRSPDEGEGFRRVSHILMPIVQKMVAENRELFATEGREGTLFIRLSERGSVVVDYV